MQTRDRLREYRENGIRGGESSNSQPAGSSGIDRPRRLDSEERKRREERRHQRMSSNGHPDRCECDLCTGVGECWTNTVGGPEWKGKGKGKDMNEDGKDLMFFI